MCVDAITGGSCQIHVEDVEDKQSHEELLQIGNRLVERPHQCGSKNGVCCTSTNDRQTELLDIDAHIKGEIHQQGICKDKPKTNGKEFPDFPF